MSNNVFKNIPSVNELLETPALKNLVDKVSHNMVVGEVRSFLDELRKEVMTRTDEVELPIPSTGEIAETIAGWISKSEKPRLHPVINATGILLHTGLGRAPMAQEAVEAVAAVAGSYASLEVDPESGQRSQRIRSVENLLCELTGAEAAAVVNNNAGATLLTLAALAGGREVIVSRGELIEIGGSYRLPEVMAAGGTILREVGTTNKTRASDYDAACCEETAALMRVHTSNYRVVGFTEAPSVKELVEVARKNDIVMIDDIGSGALMDFTKYGVAEEPVASDSIKSGADVVLFSGDKLLGGPQCGIVVGKAEYVEKIIKHPLMRALRVDKMTLAALTATLQLHRDQAKAESSIQL
ncbi:MAG: L-seryl-tRNA(Sec) selenium transferase [Planctomycetota bacterium]